MKYLFFDEEFAKCDGNGNICEFGYVITDEDLKVIEKDNIIINPNVSGNWDNYVLEEVVTYAKDYYEVQPTFDKFYYDIKAIFDSVDLVFGHTTTSDVKSLNQDCKRYNLDYINFTFYDIKEMYKEYHNYDRSVGLQNIIANENIDTFGTAHNAMYDAGNTMLCLKKMVDELEITVSDLIFMCQKTMDKTYNGIIQSEELEELLKHANYEDILDGKNGNTMYADSSNSGLFKKFKNNVEPTKEIFNQKIKDKKIAFSEFYENTHLHEMLNLVQIICNNGGEVDDACSVADYFVTYNLEQPEGVVKTSSRYKYVMRAKKRGKNIKIITLDELKELLNIKDIDLSKIEEFDRKVLFKKTNTKKIDYSLYNDKVTNTLGDFFKDFM